MTKDIINKNFKTVSFKLTFHGSLKDISLISIAYDIDCIDSFYFEFVLLGFWLRIHSIHFLTKNYLVMKTIEEVSKEYSGISMDKYSNTAHAFDKYDIQNAFETGVEFAQRWISVVEELPERSKEEPNFSNEILCKFKFDFHDVETYHTVCQYDFHDKKFKRGAGQNTNVTHWRKIELL